ncbi:lysozyme [Frigidibacter oleivorans]|uniref:lysozyme n=1 Tax=Frigidibacter oleivorans TaxID=2487129 RepID=UPI000F8DEF5F|nr:lysozyme [Frigidibacter oleivorans]
MRQACSPRGIAALMAHEGIVPAPYRDAAGIWTFGIGHTAAAGAPDPARMPRGMPTDLDAALARAVQLFAADLARHAAEVAAALAVPVAAHEFDAAVSFHFNTGAIARADWVRRLNAGDRPGAAAAMMNWTRPAALRPRREAEQRLFRDGIYPDQPVPVWQVDTAGRVRWQPLRQLSPEAAAALVQAPAKAPPAPGWIDALVRAAARLLAGRVA